MEIGFVSFVGMDQHSYNIQSLDSHSLCRVFHAHLQLKVATTYEGLQTQHARNLILDILDDPINHQEHMKR